MNIRSVSASEKITVLTVIGKEGYSLHAANQSPLTYEVVLENILIILWYVASEIIWQGTIKEKARNSSNQYR